MKNNILPIELSPQSVLFDTIPQGKRLRSLPRKPNSICQKAVKAFRDATYKEKKYFGEPIMTKIIISESYDHKPHFEQDPVETNQLATFKFTGGSNWAMTIPGNYAYACAAVKRAYQSYFKTSYGEVVLVNVTSVKHDLNDGQNIL